MTQTPNQPPATPPAPNPSATGAFKTQLETLERRSFKTYTARREASIRLGRRSRAWNASMVALATSTTVASIGMLSDEKMYGDSGPTLLVCVAVLALVASLVTSGLDYSGRSRNMFVNYRKIQRLSAKAERAIARPGSTRPSWWRG